MAWSFHSEMESFIPVSCYDVRLPVCFVLLTVRVGCVAYVAFTVQWCVPVPCFSTARWRWPGGARRASRQVGCRRPRRLQQDGGWRHHAATDVTNSGGVQTNSKLISQRPTSRGHAKFDLWGRHGRTKVNSEDATTQNHVCSSGRVMGVGGGWGGGEGMQWLHLAAMLLAV